jgi:DNA-nicking Smr family endonuclease
MTGGRRRALTDEERVLWRMATKAIAPLRLPQADAAEKPEVENETPASRPVAAKPRAQKPIAAPLQPQFQPPPAPLGRRMRARVARGKQEIDGRLDLHGLTQAQAHAALLRFLRAASARGARLVLVITGKGGGFAARGEGDAERGVLRRQLPHWLTLAEFRALVIGFEPAHIAHGGDGAWYISVRRARA